jgi:hypothetical protein
MSSAWWLVAAGPSSSVRVAAPKDVGLLKDTGKISRAVWREGRHAAEVGRQMDGQWNRSRVSNVKL